MKWLSNLYKKFTAHACWSTLLFVVLTWGVMLLFFGRLHPLVPFDLDDWQYMSHIRAAYPLWGDWNPTRVFPEVFIPLSSMIGVAVVQPFVGDYLESLILVNALLISGFITLYVTTTKWFFEQKFGLQPWASALLSWVVLLLHFMLFRVNQSGNFFAFFCDDVCCYYYYIIPATLSLSLMMWLLVRDAEGSYWRWQTFSWRKALLLLSLYLCLFSNLYVSILPAMFFGLQALVRLVKDRKIAWVPTSFVLVWLLVVIPFDAFSGRAHSFGTEEVAYSDQLVATIQSLGVLKLQGTFVLLSLAVVAGWVALHLVRKTWKQQGVVALWLLGMAATYLFLVLLSGKVCPQYVERPYVMFPFYALLLLLVGYCLAELVSACRKSALLLPLLLLVLLCKTNTSEDTFRDQQYNCDFHISLSVRKRIMNDCIQQLVLADAQGMKATTLVVPKLKDEVWPFCPDTGYAMMRTLLKHGMIHQKMDVQVVFSEQRTQQYHLDNL